MKKLFILIAILAASVMMYGQTTVDRAMSVWARNIVNANFTTAFANTALRAPIDSPTFTGVVTLDSSMTLGTFGDATQTVLSEASSNTNVLLGVYPMINFAGTAGKVFAGSHNRMMAITTHQTNNVSIYGAENQFRLKGVNLGQGVFSGVWAYAEQSGTSVLSGGASFSGLHAAIESAATFTAGATEHILGVSINSSINAGASGTINASANYSGIYIQSSGLDFYDGIYITGAVNDIKLQNDAEINNVIDTVLSFNETVIVANGKLEVNGSGPNFAPDEQADDDYEINLPNIDALTTGMMVVFTATTANTDGASLEITTVGDVDAILKMNDQAVVTGDIEAGQVVVCVWDGSNWQMTSQLAQ